VTQAHGPDGTSSGPSRGNHFLRELSTFDRELLEPQLSLVSLGRDHVLVEAGDEIEWVYFPCDGTMVSLAVVMPGGQKAETTLIGLEGVVGGIVDNGPRPAFARVSVQLPGEAWKLPIEALETARSRSATLGDSFARYADCLLAQLLQHVACKVLHNLEQRMARLLLNVHRRQADADLPLTHEALADLLGVGRTYVTRTASALQERRLIEYGRGRIRLIDLPGLEGFACPCEKAVERHFERVLPGVYPIDAS